MASKKVGVPVSSSPRVCLCLSAWSSCGDSEHLHPSFGVDSELHSDRTVLLREANYHALVSSRRGKKEDGTTGLSFKSLLTLELYQIKHVLFN